MFRDSNGVALPVQGVQASDHSASSTVTRAYDPVGNLVSMDGPAAGAGDTTRYVYDALRRLVATIGPDADGTANLLLICLGIALGAGLRRRREGLAD